MSLGKCIFIVISIWLVYLTNPSLAQKDTTVTESGLKYFKIKETTAGRPKIGEKIKVRYTGRLLSGEIFQATNQDEYFMFKIGDPGIIKGWNEGFQLMNYGEKAVFIIPPWLGYGSKGAIDPTGEKQYIVPPDSTIIFEVELISK
jgi:FKBP-type peptidyl-prolyl cis-trans isomerase